MLKEFREFAMRGNALDMAVGIILGAAFGTIVSSLVDDVIMPPIGLLLGGVDFSNIFVNLSGQPYDGELRPLDSDPLADHGQDHGRNGALQRRQPAQP